MSNNISESILETGLMKNLLENLTSEETSDLKDYIDEFLQPFDDITVLIEDMMSTETSREKLAEDITRLFTEEGIQELEKCLEKN